MTASTSVHSSQVNSAARVYTAWPVFSGERELARLLAGLPDPELHLWFGLNYLPNIYDIDCLIWHETAGVFVVEVKAVSLNMIEEYDLRHCVIQGRGRDKSPPQQAFNAREALRHFLLKQASWVPFLASTACWPVISRSSWKAYWSDPYLAGPYADSMLFSDDLQGVTELRNRLLYIWQTPPVRVGAKYPFRHSPEGMQEFDRLLNPMAKPKTPADAERFATVGHLHEIHRGQLESQSAADGTPGVLSLINGFAALYEQRRTDSSIPPGSWLRHVEAMRSLADILAAVLPLAESDATTWNALAEVEERLKSFFDDAQGYGPLSRSVIGKLDSVSEEIRRKSVEVDAKVTEFVKLVNRMSPLERGSPDVAKAVESFRQMQAELIGDLNARKLYDELARRVQVGWCRFLELRASLAVQRNYRPTLKLLDRLCLHEHQEQFVEKNYPSYFRIQGASGSGKTIVLLHRALRLARENRDAMIRIFTINRALAELLRNNLAAIEGALPDNIQVAALYDFLNECVSLFDGRGKFRLVDERSGERIAIAWRDFFNHHGSDADQNVFADRFVRKLIEQIKGWRIVKVDASLYLREEMIYIQSAYRFHERKDYLSNLRQGRSGVLGKLQKNTCLKILAAWEDWLHFGDLCDIDGLTLHAAEYFYDDAKLVRIRSELPTDFVLIDEAQDFSTVELGIMRRLVTDPDGENRFFLVGDPKQKVYPKQHDSSRVGFSWIGKSKNLTRNYRNTRQILRAAYHIPTSFPPKSDEQIPIADAELSAYEGGKPVAFQCLRRSHVDIVIRLLTERKGNRTAVISENDEFLRDVQTIATRKGFRCYQLLRNEDIDLWKQQEGNSLSAGLVVSRMDAVKGFEFDTVIACDLSKGVTPRRGSLPEEYWREAAVVYSALTRARDELIITYVGRPSVFLTCMGDDVDFLNEVDERLTAWLEDRRKPQ